MADLNKLKAGTLLNPNQRREELSSLEARRYLESLRDSREAQNLQDAILATLKAIKANKPYNP